MDSTLQTAATHTQGQRHGADRPYRGVSIDTRTLQPGQLYIALPGPNYDGHDYLAQAAAAGAVGAMVQRRLPHALPQIVVSDTRRALGQLAAAWRNQAQKTTWIGITGSNGKTTVKEMLTHILSQRHAVLATQGNLNNDIGLPLTLLRWQGEPYAVIEMGANHPGEIGYLSQIARPQIAVLNNAGRAHLAGFGSVQGVAQAKIEIIQGLTPEGTFIYNADDTYAPFWQTRAAQHRTRTFGLRQPANVRAQDYHIVWQADGFAATFNVYGAQPAYPVQLQLAGQHNQMNALAAIAVAEALGIPVADIQAGLAALPPVPGRLKPYRVANGWVIDDSYNANADSVQAALQVLQQAPGHRTLVLGDLAETGDAETAHYTEIGQQARHDGIECLLSCGQPSQQASTAFGQGGQHFTDQNALIQHLRTTQPAEGSILIKGSRSAHMEQVVQQLIQP